MSTAPLSQAEDGPRRKLLWLVVVVAALGYFVDTFDFVLFGVVRIASLRDLGVDARQFAAVGESLQNHQLIGLCIGGLLWGVLGDTLGRRTSLFASIVVHAIANLLTARVATVEEYAMLRLVAGIGLAGELGTGVTLVSELLHTRWRGWGTAIIAAMGVAGGLAASQLGTQVPWRLAYLVAGGLGVLLLLLRIGVIESGLFISSKASSQEGARRGQFWRLLSAKSGLARYVMVIGVAIPIWYCVSILTYFSREIGEAMGMTPRPQPATALLYCYVGLGLGDITSSLLSQHWQSRRRVLKLFLTLSLGAVAAYFTVARSSLGLFYAVCAFMGFACGYWAVFVTTVAEQFGTNLRATATTTAPNFVRAAVVPMTLLFGWLHQTLGVQRAAGYAIVGAVCFLIAALSLWRLPETFGRNLDFVED